MKKRNIALLLAFVIFVMAFAGCAKKEKIDVNSLDPEEILPGKWKSSVMYDLKNNRQTDLEAVANFKEDHTGKLEFGGEEYDISWEYLQTTDNVVVYYCYMGTDAEPLVMGIQYDDSELSGTLALVISDLMIVFEKA